MTKELGNKELMAQNIKRLLDSRGMTVKDLANVLDLAPTTVYSWTQAQAYPRIDKIEMMANFFGVSKSELVEDRSSVEETIQETFDRRPEMRGLFSVTKNCTPEQVKRFTKMIEAYLEEN